MQKSCSWSQSRDFPVSVLVSTKFVSSYSDCYESQVYRIVLCHKRLIKSLKGHESLGMILNVEIKGVSVSEWVSEWHDLLAVSYAVFVYLRICICVFVYLIVQNIIFDILEPPAVQKYSICWVFRSFCHTLYLCICVFAYLYLCICVSDSPEYHFWHPWTTSCSKI